MNIYSRLKLKADFYRDEVQLAESPEYQQEAKELAIWYGDGLWLYEYCQKLVPDGFRFTFPNRTRHKK